MTQRVPGETPLTGLAPSWQDPEATRHARRDELSLALIDARNRTLRWLARFEEVPPPKVMGPASTPIWRCIGHVGWFQEFWIARHLQRARGEDADPDARRLPSIHPRADAWFSPRHAGDADAARADGPDPPALRTFLADTLDLTLDLLDGSADTDQALYVFRLALLHEDRMAERLAVEAQWRGLDPGPDLGPPRPPRRAVERAPVWLPAATVTLGSPPGGLVPPNERWAHPVRVPECEIDAQVVSWARFAEFADDGGYDEPTWWSAEGWRWAQASDRRAPRGVVQWRGGVSVERFGQVRRCPAAEAAVHVTWHEAQAWCAWAGRRLPTEAEWVRALATAPQTGFTWGEALEWMLGSARLWNPDQAPRAGFSMGVEGTDRRVLRGASLWTVPRAAHAQARRFAAPTRDDLMCGFRSCAA